MELTINFADPEDKRRLYAHLKSCKPVPYKITLKPDRDAVSAKQRGYYRGVIIPTIADHMGYPPEEYDQVHEILKSKFNSRRVYVRKAGKHVKVVFSTESLDVKEYGEYMDKILRWSAMEMGLNIPDPHKTIIQAI